MQTNRKDKVLETLIYFTQASTVRASLATIVQ